MINQLILQANLVADPELKHTPNDIPVCKFRVAWNDGKEEQRKTLFMTCVAWRNTAEFICKYFKKGSQILLQGHLLTEQYEKDGTMHYSTEMTVDKCHFCGSKSSGQISEVKQDTKSYNNDDEDLPF